MCMKTKNKRVKSKQGVGRHNMGVEENNKKMAGGCKSKGVKRGEAG